MVSGLSGPSIPTPAAPMNQSPACGGGGEEPGVEDRSRGWRTGARGRGQEPGVGGNRNRQEERAIQEWSSLSGHNPAP